MAPRNGNRPEYKAGQVAVLEMDGKSAYVAFASSPEDDEIEFLVKRGENPGVTSSLFDPLIEKNIVIKDVVGRGFAVEEHKGCDLVFVAMGTGLAPLRSALRQVFHERKAYGRLIVLYGVRTVDDFCFAQEMTTEWSELGIELRQVISQPGESEWSGSTGYVQSLLDNLIPTLQQPIALVCGSKEMIEQTRERLLSLGFAPEKILTNY